MGLPTNMFTYIAKAVAGESTTPFNNANAHIGVGDGTSAFAVGQTDLLGANKLRKKVDVNFPTRSNSKLTFKSTFGEDDANFDWKEWGVFNASTGGDMLNRLVENNGTKSGGTWAFTVEIEFN